MSGFKPFQGFDEVNAQLASIGEEITDCINNSRGSPDFEQRFLSLTKLRREVLSAAESLADAYVTVPTTNEIDTHYGTLGVIQRKIDAIAVALKSDRSAA